MIEVHIPETVEGIGVSSLRAYPGAATWCHTS
jgi:hypothetical protein